MTIFSDNPHDRRIERFMTAIPNFKPRGVGVRFSESQILITVTAATPTEILTATMRQIRCPPFRKRFNEYIESEETPMTYLNEKHRARFTLAAKNIAKANYALLSALYLLTADQRLWSCCKHHINNGCVFFENIKLNNCSERAYTLYCAAKDLTLGTKHITVSDLSDADLVPPMLFRTICNAMAIRRFGLAAIKEINNATFEALIEIVKKDAETGKIIPASGIGFKVRNTDTGEYIVQHINYPTPMDIDTYYTDVTGKLMMPDKLPYGNYEIIEQCTAYGYVLDSAPIAFKVDGSKTVVTVEKHNMPQKGIVNISKSGEVFFSAVESDGVYSFVFADKGLAGAVYEITAAEDIITPDGTLRYAKGTVVDTVTTDENGNAASKPLYLGKYTIRETKAPYGMVLNDEAKSVELTYAGETVKLTETSAEFYNERQKAEVSLSKVLGKDETFGIGNNGEILSVQFGLYAAEDLTAADGSVIPKDGLLEIANCNENGNIAFKTDIPVGAKLYVKEIAADSHYILSDEKHPVTFEYAGQDTALVEIKVNGGEAIKNDILYGSVKGLKIDRETDAVIAGAKFGLFRSVETEFTAETAILTAESGEDGVFAFENIPYGDWLIKELQPADGYLANEEIYPVSIAKNEQTVEITVVNDRIPEVKTTAAVDGEKEICATEVFTLTDTVSYSHLIPGKEYVLKGVLMDKNTGKAFTENGEAVTAETAFTPETPNGTVTVSFTFDSRLIKESTSLVVFETLYKDGKELAVHADIEDEDQTVKVTVPEIGTKATVNGEKSATAKGDITIEDTVSYKNLTVGKEYTVKGILII